MVKEVCFILMYHKGVWRLQHVSPTPPWQDPDQHFKLEMVLFLVDLFQSRLTPGLGCLNLTFCL